jgi:hypothetical protein
MIRQQLAVALHEVVGGVIGDLEQLVGHQLVANLACGATRGSVTRRTDGGNLGRGRNAGRRCLRTLDVNASHVGPRGRPEAPIRYAIVATGQPNH